MNRIRWQMVREEGPETEPFKTGQDVGAYLVRQRRGGSDEYL
jgi:hypothetical protein